MHRRPPALAPLLVAGSLLAAAATPAAAFNLRLGVEAMTDLPLGLGGKAWLELPANIRISASLAYIPAEYIDVMNAVMVAAGGYNDATGDMIRSALDTSLAFRGHVGWRPWDSRGFYFELGYGMVSLGGGLGSQEMLALATGRTAPTSEDAGRSYKVSSTLHMVDAELGWMWFFLVERISLRIAVGVGATVASSTSVSPDYTPRKPALVSQFTRAAEQYLDDTYTSYVFTPVLSVGVGYRFF